MLTIVDSFYFIMRGRLYEKEIHRNHIRLRARSRMTSHHTWGPVTATHDFGGVSGRRRFFGHFPFGLSQFHGHSSWLVCESGPPPIYDQGEPAVSYKWTSQVWEITTVVGIQNCIKITNHFKRIYKIYPQSNKGKPEGVNMWPVGLANTTISNRLCPKTSSITATNYIRQTKKTSPDRDSALQSTTVTGLQSRGPPVAQSRERESMPAWTTTVGPIRTMGPPGSQLTQAPNFRPCGLATDLPS